MTDLEYWIWLASLRKLRPTTRLRLLELYGSPGEIYESDRRELCALPGLLPEERSALALRDEGQAGRVLQRCRELGAELVTCRDPVFPQRLRNIPEPPLLLYVLGRLPEAESVPWITLVGTRSASAYGRKMALRLGRELAERGAVVVTGLAAGIDACAAEGALSAGGKVVGVLGVGINQIYPRANGELYGAVRTSGALVSEYPPDVRGSAYWFRVRNRIMAGLSLGVGVIEAPERSGALITASLANEYGRDVFAVPGNCDAPGSRGTNRLLRNCARLVESGRDILEDYEYLFPGISGDRPEKKRPASNGAGVWGGNGTGSEPRERLSFPPPPAAASPRPAEETLAGQLAKLSEHQLKIVGAMTAPGIHIDEIIAASGLPASLVLSELTLLQVKGYVSQEPGRRFTLKLRA